MNEATPGLWLLMGAYLYQDWLDEYGDIWTALEDFVANEPQAALVPDEIAELLLHEDQALVRLVDDLGADYDPTWNGGTYRGWLEEVAHRVSKALDQTE